MRPLLTRRRIDWLLEQGRHSATAKNSGGSNFVFADGSVRYLPYGKMLTPENLWAIADSYRYGTPE